MVGRSLFPRLAIIIIYAVPISCGQVGLGGSDAKKNENSKKRPRESPPSPHPPTKKVLLYIPLVFKNDDRDRIL